MFNDFLKKVLCLMFFFSKREELPYFKLKPHRLAIWYINKSNKHTPKYFSKKSFEQIIKLNLKLDR